MFFHICDHYAKMYGSEIFDNQFLKKQFRLWQEFNISLSANSSIFPHKIDTTQVRSSKKRRKGVTQAEIPGSIVVGGVEVLAGALACILPIPGARVFGVGLMTDGCRRVLNGAEELDKSNQQDRMRRRYNMKYDFPIPLKPCGDLQLCITTENHHLSTLKDTI